MKPKFKKPRFDWVCICPGKIKGQTELVCLRCGDTSILNYPITIDSLVRKMKGFTMMHRDCKAEGGES